LPDDFKEEVVERNEKKKESRHLIVDCDQSFDVVQKGMTGKK